MGKYVFILLNLIGYIYYSYIRGDDVVITVKAPTEIQAGSDFKIYVTITKTKDIERFARFYQELPIGLTAEEDETKNAIFSFKNQQAKFIWMPGALPEVDTFTIAYTVHVDITVSGKVIIPGQFVYIKNNERAEIKVEPIEITVKSATDIAGDSTLMATQDSVKATVVTTASGITENTKLDTRRVVTINNGEANISVILYKKGIDGMYAKVEEKIPNGMVATAVDNGNAIFSFDNQTVKYLWESLPAGDSLVVTYKLKKQDGTALTKQELNLIGQFSYLDGNKTINKTIQPPENIEKDILTAQNEKPAMSKISNATNNDVATIDNAEKNRQEEALQNYASQENPVAKISYRVQICALKEKRRSPQYIRKLYRLSEPVFLEDNEGWKKYTIGNYFEYKEARNRRVELWRTTPVKDAFVSAYNNGMRITVQEALMIANQKWIQ